MMCYIINETQKTMPVELLTNCTNAHQVNVQLTSCHCCIARNLSHYKLFSMCTNMAPTDLVLLHFGEKQHKTTPKVLQH